MAHATSVSALPRSVSPMPKHAGLRSMTPSRVHTRSSQGMDSNTQSRSRSLVRGRSEYQRGASRTTTMAMATTTAEADCFSTLGLTPAASATEIRQAYRTLAKKYHPDANPSDGASSKFVDLRSAYEMCLSKGLSKDSTRESAAESSPIVRRKTRRSTTTAATTVMNSSPARTNRRSVRKDAWDDIWDEMLSSPKSSRRRR